MLTKYVPFAIDKSKTYNLPVPTSEQRDYRTWVSTPSSGLDKRLMLGLTLNLV